MTTISAAGRDTNEPGDTQLIANILLDAARDDRHSAKDGRKVQGWDTAYRNRLVREAGCGHNTAYYLLKDLARELRA